MNLETVLEKLNAVQRTLTQQQQHLDALNLVVQAATTAQAAETVDASAPAATAAICGCPCPPSQCQAAVNGVPSVYCRLSRGVAAAQETVSASEAGAAPAHDWKNPPPLETLRAKAEAAKPSAYNIEAGAAPETVDQYTARMERAAYLRGFEQAKALLLAVKPEPERGPDNFLWVNVYKTADGVYWLGSSHQTKEGCDGVGSSYSRIARVRVWFNEGQFDD